MAYTTIDDPSAYFQIALWTGDGTAGNAVTFDGNSDMQPDWVWSKRRDVGYGHVLKDTSRGGTSNNDQHLVSNSTAAESTYTNYRMDFDSDGFTLDGVGDSGFQGSGTSMVSWAWKANGGTTSSNTDGTITSTVQANTTAGFSIVTFTSAASGSFSVGHGLGVKPDMVITKRRADTSNWWTWHKGLTNDTTYYLDLSATSAEASASNMWGTAGFTSSVFGMNYPASAYSSSTYVAYCFAEKKGYSKFGTYTGRGLGDVATGRVRGKYVHTGFKPAFVMTKATSTAANWQMYSHKVPTYEGNVINLKLGANRDAAENGSDLGNTSQNNVDFCANGFRWTTGNTDTNSTNQTYVYMAFAEHPFVTSTGNPVTAR